MTNYTLEVDDTSSYDNGYAPDLLMLNYLKLWEKFESREGMAPS